MLDPFAGNRHRPFHRFQLAVNPGPVHKTVEGAAILQEEHEGFRKVLAGVGRGVIGDELAE